MEITQLFVQVDAKGEKLNKCFDKSWWVSEWVENLMMFLGFIGLF